MKFRLWYKYPIHIKDWLPYPSEGVPPFDKARVDLVLGVWKRSYPDMPVRVEIVKK